MTGMYSLRKFNPEKDLQNLFRVYSDYSEQYKLFSVMSLNCYESFINQFNRQLDRYKEFVIIEVEEVFAGFIAAYDFKNIDGHIKAMIYIEPRFRYSVIGLAGLEFVSILFQYYNIRKVYTEVYSYNEDSIKYHVNAGFVEECRLKEYKFFDGEYWDVIYFSITRSEFYKKNGDIVSRFLQNRNRV